MNLAVMLGAVAAGVASAMVLRRAPAVRRRSGPVLGQHEYPSENALSRTQAEYRRAVASGDQAAIDRTYSEYRRAYEEYVGEAPVREELDRLFSDYMDDAARATPDAEGRNRAREARMEEVWPGWLRSHLEWEIHRATGGQPAWYRALKEAGAGALSIAVQLVPFARGLRPTTAPVRPSVATPRVAPPAGVPTFRTIAPATRLPVQPPAYAPAATAPAAGRPPSPVMTPSAGRAVSPVELPAGGYIRGAPPGVPPSDVQVEYLSNAYNAARTAAAGLTRSEARVQAAARAAVQYRRLTPDAQFRTAMRAVYSVSDEPTRVAIAREMAAWNATGRVTPALQRLWERATGLPLPVPTIPAAPAGPSPGQYVPAPPGVVIPPTETARIDLRTGQLTYPRAVVEQYLATQVTPRPGTIRAVRPEPPPVPTVPAAPPRPVLPGPVEIAPPTAPTGYVAPRLPYLPFGIPLATPGIPFGLGSRAPVLRRVSVVFGRGA